MFWQRQSVFWERNLRLLGQQQVGSSPINFGDQRGVYLLRDRDRVVYFGRSIDRPMGQQLYEHTKDRLNGRWDRFSRYGLKTLMIGCVIARIGCASMITAADGIKLRRFNGVSFASCIQVLRHAYWRRVYVRNALSDLDQSQT